MSTKRQQRLARAIEGLSGRDLVEFARFVSDSLGVSKVYGVQSAVLNYSKKVSENAAAKPKIHT